MRAFITISVLITGALSQSVQDYLNCASSALANADVSKFSDCTDKPAHACVCKNKEAISNLSTGVASACAGIDLAALTSSLCHGSHAAPAAPAAPVPDAPAPAPARHASMPMQPAKRDHSNEDGTQVIYVTETRNDCSCKSTPIAESPAHVSQIPVDVPVSSMGPMVTGAAPNHSHGVLGRPSSVIFGPQASAATPSPSGVDPSRFSSFEGAAAPGVAVNGGVVVGVAAVIGFMAAL
ncbi:hypothetical protein N7457_000286 [Penicillium paradoxum]|uniref:uncharacterized protein n=1 Tax=Penicillium paradoxum TaxID=176176 RepID=UPI002547E87F|nr:uncharacterized protein N7457_000286 [Penicillium paradoxum]KAJ5793687.1 hypothetical protein N7457_000286 [Penicillium paradoxum]